MRRLALALALLGMVAAAPSAEAPSEDQASRSRRQRTEMSSIPSSSTTTNSHLDLISTSHLPAPPPPPPPRRLPPEEDATTDLSAALRDLARRKRQASGHSHRPYSSPARSISGIHRPYSAFRPLSRIRRYRYPLYRKRSYSPAQDYDSFEDEFQLPALDQALSDDYEDDEEDYQRPSLFRERTVKRASSFRENSLKNNDGAFSETPIPSSNLLPSAYGGSMMKKDSVYNLAHAPYDLHAMGRLYEVGKRSGGGNLNSSPYKLDSLAHMYSTGKRDSGNMVTSPYQLDTLARMYSAGKRSVNPSGAEQFHEAISALRKRKLEEAIEDSIRTSKRSYASDAEEYERLREFFESAAGNYMRRSAGLPDSLVRRRRDITSTSRRSEETAVTSGSSNVTNTSQRQQQQHKPPAKMATPPTIGAATSNEMVTKSSSQNPTLPAGDRQKRAFSDYFQWNRRKKSVPAADPKGDLEKREDYDDFLTREYFKTIARSVGNKKKRMAYAQFEAKKRSVGVEEIIESPTMLQYMQEKLKDAEDSTVDEAEELLMGKSDEATVKATLSTVIARLDALERMSEALQQLKELEQEKEVDQKKKRMSPAMVNSAMQERRKKEDEDKRKRTAAAEEEEQEKRRRKKGEENKKKKRGDGYPLEFLGDSPEEECPVLDRVVINCNGVSELVGDNDRVFFSACNRHEVCYMCGSSLGVTGHECDALLSSALEASCGGQRDCLGAAADAFNILSDPERYDEEGTCTRDPCIRRYLESR